MVMIHKKYEDIINKIKSSEGQLFLIKCKTSQGEYHFLARYKNDTFDKYMTGDVMFTGFNPTLVMQKQQKDIIH